jgi:transposase-like protein
MFPWLKPRGLQGVEVLVSDAQAGLVQAAQRHFQGVIWQRWQGHLARHVWGRTPRHLRAQLAAGLRRLFQAEDVAAASRLIGALVAEQHEAWSTGKRYVDMTEDLEWQATQASRARRCLREVSGHNAQRRNANLQHILDLTALSSRAIRRGNF